MFEWTGWAPGDGDDDLRRVRVLRAAEHRILHLESLEPDGEVASALARMKPHSLTANERVRALRLSEAHACWAAAQQHRWLSSVVGERVERPAQLDDDERFKSMEVATILRITEGMAQRRIASARALDKRFPGAVPAMTAGAMTGWHAAVLVEETRQLDDESARRLEQAALKKASSTTVNAFRAYVRKLVIKADADVARRRELAARRDRRVRFVAMEDGMALVEAILPAADAVTVWQALEVHAVRAKQADPADTRTLSARRADALSGLCADYLADPTHPMAHGRRISLGVTADLPTVLGVANEPGELEGYGAITAETVRELAGDAEWRLMLTDAAKGHLVHLSTRSYKPTRRLADFITARDKTCRFPNCERPAYRCEIDHRVPFDHAHPDRGGATDEDNCGLLCKRHHIAKHESQWRVDANGDGELRWTSPAGITHVVRQPDYRPLAAADTDVEPDTPRQPPDLTKPTGCPPGQKPETPPMIMYDDEPPF